MIDYYAIIKCNQRQEMHNAHKTGRRNMANFFFVPSKSVDYLRFGALLNNMITCLLHGQATHYMCFSQLLNM